MAELRGIILDVDGTLVDSNDANARAWVAALAEGGFAIPFERVRPLIGMGGDQLLPEAAGITKGSLRGQRISKRWGEIFQERYLPDLRPFPQTRALVEWLRADRLRVVIASSSESGILDQLLKIAGIADLIDAATSSSDAERSKPAPDLIRAALAKGKLAPERTLMLGDTPYDIEAASKVGVRTIAVRCGGWGDRDLGGAIAIYDDPADLLAHFTESPLARAAQGGAR